MEQSVIRSFDSWSFHLHLGTRFSKLCTEILAIKDVIGLPLLSNSGSIGQESTHSSVTEFDNVIAAFWGNCNGLIVWLGSSAVRVLAR